MTFLPLFGLKAFDTMEWLWQLRQTVCKIKVQKVEQMPKEEWGVKRVCPTTGKRFYDLNKSPIVSPYTNDIVELDQNKNRMIAADAEDMSTVRDKDSDLESEDIVLEQDTNDVEVDLADDILEDDEEDTVPLEEIADMSSDDES